MAIRSLIGFFTSYRIGSTGEQLTALASETPKRRYLLVGDADTANLTIGSAMQQLLQLNQDQAYTMSREQLIKILHEQLKTLNEQKDDKG